MEQCGPSPEDSFEKFLYTDSTVEDTLNEFVKIKNVLSLNEVPHHLFFSSLKKYFSSWKVVSFLEILQKRLNNRVYAKHVEDCKNSHIFVVGAGPCGLRFAIEAALCGCRVVVVEKRASFTRNNVLHLWPYLIEDLRNIGIKKLFGKFCAGSLDHISIRRLQLILLKIALILGVEIYTSTSFVKYLEPCNSTGWRVACQPPNLKIEQMDFHVLVGADGKRNSIPGFQRKEFRAKLAIGITANFVNKNTEQEARIEEISGVAALFNQKFFNDLKTELGIELENIVYYKDDTHYFVMTAKKTCLLEKKVLRQDYSDIISLLSYTNVDMNKLQDFVREAADFSTGLPHSDLAINPDNGKEDVAIFDFTSMYSAEYAAKILERKGKRLLIGLVGDGLMEPFWPLGTGCARGFLSCFDLVWMITRMNSGVAPGELLTERMALYQILHQTSNENMCKKHGAYTIEPRTRYKLIPSFKDDVSHLYDCSEDKENSIRIGNEGTLSPKPTKRKLAGETTETVHKQWKKSTFARTRKPKNPTKAEIIVPKKRVSSPLPDIPAVHDNRDTLLAWCQTVLKPLVPTIPITDLDVSWKDGMLLCTLAHLCSPKDINMQQVKRNTDQENVELAISVMFNEFGLQLITVDDVLPPHGPDLLAIMGTILEMKRIYEEMQTGLTPRTKKTKTNSVDIESSSPPSQQSPPKDGVADPVKPPAPGTFKKRVRSQKKVRKKTEHRFIAEVDDSVIRTKESTPSKGSQKCHTCSENVLLLNRVAVEGYVFHRKCFICEECSTQLKTSTYHLINSKQPKTPGSFYCKTHFNKMLSRSREKKLSSAKVMPIRKQPPRPQSTCLPRTPYKPLVQKKSPPIIEEQSKSVSFDVSERKSTPTRVAVSVSETGSTRQQVKTRPPIETRRRVKKLSRDFTAEASPSPPPTDLVDGKTSPQMVFISPTTKTKTKADNSEKNGDEVKKKLEYNDVLPEEKMTDKKSGTETNLRKTDFDVLPQETVPAPPPDNNFVTARKKSKSEAKTVGATGGKKLKEGNLHPPRSQTYSQETSKKIFKKNSGSNFISGSSNPVLISESAVKLSKDQKSDGIQGRVVKKAMHGNRVTSRPTPRGLPATPDVSSKDIAPKNNANDKGKPALKTHVDRIKPPRARADSMNNMDKFTPTKRSTRREQEGPPPSVKDRIAMFQNNDNKPSTYSHPGEKKRISVTNELAWNVSMETSRIHYTRTKNILEEDAPPKHLPSTVTTRKRRRPRLKPLTKQNQRRLEQAQMIQRDRSLLEQKMVEFESQASTVERQLRRDGNEELLSVFLELVNIKNNLMRRENELHLCERYLQLLDEEEQTERDFRFISDLPSAEKTPEDIVEEEKLILKKIDVVNRRDALLTQVDKNRKMEEEEDEMVNAMLSEKGMSSNLYSYNPEIFITIDSLLEADEGDFETDVSEEDTSATTDSQAVVHRKKKKKKSKRNRENGNALSRIFGRLSFFGE